VEKKIPTGKLSRLAKMAALTARTGRDLVFSKGESTKAADRAAEVLGTMRGIAAKVGQMASYVDGVVPESHRDTYENSLRVLRAQAPRSSFDEISRTVEEDLGAPISSLFKTFDAVPIASASIGQVHRASIVVGGEEREVAVKVQHARIREAVESDLSNFGIVESFAGLLGAKRFDPKAMLETVSARFTEELDYTLERERMAAFAALHAGDPTILIPNAYASHSSARILTTDFVRGLSFDEACTLPEANRRAYAETLWRFVFKGNLVGGMFNADPHPGNYFFHENGAVTFIDFGCVQKISDSKRPFARMIHRAALDNDGPTFERGVSGLVDAKPGRLEALAQAYTRLCFEPLFSSPYRITRAYAASLVSEMKTMGSEAKKLPEADFFKMPVDMLFMNRLQFGFYSVLARLDCEVDYASVEREFLPPNT